MPTVSVCPFDAGLVVVYLSVEFLVALYLQPLSHDTVIDVLLKVSTTVAAKSMTCMLSKEQFTFEEKRKRKSKAEALSLYLLYMTYTHKLVSSDLAHIHCLIQWLRPKSREE